MALAIPRSEARSYERLRHHYEVEKELAGRLRGAGLVRALEGALLRLPARLRCALADRWPLKALLNAAVVATK